MTVKMKVILLYPLIALRNFRARRLAKKASKEHNEEKYPVQWKNDYVIKKAIKFTKNLSINLVVKGFENIPRQSSIITPNHQSAFDAMVLIAALKNPEHGPEALNPLVTLVGKDELRKNKKIKGYADLMGSFYINRKSPRESLKILDEAVTKAKDEKSHLVIFPEGTRTLDGNLQTFRGGAFRIAKKSFLSITPVTINNTVEVSNLKRSKRVTVEVIFHPSLKPMSFISSSNEAIGERVRKIVASVYKKPNISNNVESKLA